MKTQTKLALLAALLLNHATVLMAADYAKEYAAIAADGTASNSVRLNRLFTVAWDQKMHDFPEIATQVGYPGLNGKWPDWSWDAIQRRKEETKERLNVLETIDRAKLTAQEQLSYDIFQRDLNHAIEGQVFPMELLPLSQMEGVQLIVPDTIALMPHETAKDYENITSRLKKLPAFVDQIIDLLQRGMAKGIVQPAEPLTDLPPQIQALIPADPMKSPLLQHFTKFPDDFPAAEQDRLRAEALKAYQAEAEPAYRKLYEFVTKKYIPACRNTLGLTALPGGEEWYAYKVREETTTSLTPKEVHEIGLREVARILAKMDQLQTESGFKGSREEFVEFLQSDPQFYYTTADGILDGFRIIAMRILPVLPKYFGKLPQLPFGVKPTPAYAENSAPDAIYEFGSMKAGRAGYFVANTSRLETRPKWEMVSLTLHEGVPGHHLQISLAQEQENVPDFRRYNFNFTAYIEGWALYSESLGYEMGIYQNAYEKFGACSDEILRASRLVIDTGLHTMGWTRDQSIKYLAKNTGFHEKLCAAEVDRFITWPGQATAYKIGEIKIQALRGYATRELGDAFDLRDFHDFILSNGALPLEILESLVKEWVAEAKKSPEPEEKPDLAPPMTCPGCDG